MVKKKVLRSRRDLSVTRSNTLHRKAKALAKRWRYYKDQPPKALRGVSEELRSLITREITNWRTRNGK